MPIAAATGDHECASRLPNCIVTECFFNVYSLHQELLLGGLLRLLSKLRMRVSQVGKVLSEDLRVLVSFHLCPIESVEEET